MKRLICDVDDLIHQNFKSVCAVKGVKMKEKLQEFVELYIKYSENEMDTTDLIKALVQKERKQEQNKPKEVSKPIEIKKESNESEKALEKASIITKFKQLKEKCSMDASWGSSIDKSKMIKVCEGLIKKVDIFNQKYPLDTLSTRPMNELLKDIKDID